MGLDHGDPTTGGPRQPRVPEGIPPNRDLCKECNASLHLDDSILEPFLRHPTGLFTFKAAESPRQLAVFGGIDYVRKDIVPTLPALSHAADTGCQFCSAIRRGLHVVYRGDSWWKPHPEPLTLRIQYRWTVRCQEEHEPDRIDLNSIVVSVFHAELGKWEEEVIQFLLYATGEDNLCKEWLNLGTLGDDVWSSKNISMSQRWLEECVGESGGCAYEPTDFSDAASDEEPESGYPEMGQTRTLRTGESIAMSLNPYTSRPSRMVTHPKQMDQTGVSSGSLFVPTRLLDLFPAQAQNMCDIVLVETQHLQNDPKLDQSQHRSTNYAALSYCWGTVQPRTKTMKGNIDRHLMGIKLSELPNCLQDAVTVARSLEIRYLWIDALCIIQDDDYDWGRESGMMAQIFRNSLLTIAAASSESFDEGFINRDSFQGIHMPFSSVLEPQIAGEFFISTIVNLRPDKLTETTDSPLQLDLQYSRWNKRGWVWQERELSERLLIFGKRMIHFRCQHSTRSGNGSLDHGPANDLLTMGRGTFNWVRSVEQYSANHLTFLCDKLPAISGFAKLADHNSISMGDTSAQYLAGIWLRPARGRGELFELWRMDLYWQVNAKQQSFKSMLEQFKNIDSATYTAPTWSWASRAEGAQWTDKDLELGGQEHPDFHADIENHEIRLTGPDPMGRVGPGSYIKLSGLMFQEALDIAASEPAGDRFQWTMHLPALTNFEITPRSSKEKGKGEEVKGQQQSLSFSLDWNFSPADRHVRESGHCVRLFGLGMTRFGTRPVFQTGNGSVSWFTSGPDRLKGLLLLQDSETGHFYRVGCFLLETPFDRKKPDPDETAYQQWKRQSVHLV